jgi:transposase
MPGPKIHPDTRRIAIRLLMDHDYLEVAAKCGISESSVRRIAKTFQSTGSMDPIPGTVKRGRKAILAEEDHEVSPDI